MATTPGTATSSNLQAARAETAQNSTQQSTDAEAALSSQLQSPSNYGLNNEELEKHEPEVVIALRDLIYNYRREGIVIELTLVRHEHDAVSLTRAACGGCYLAARHALSLRRASPDLALDTPGY